MIRALAFWGLYLALMCGLAYVSPAFPDEQQNSVSCSDHNFDVGKIAAAIRQGIPKEKLLYHLGKGTGMEPERVTQIRALIDDAYKQTDIERWRAKNRCIDS